MCDHILNDHPKSISDILNLSLNKLINVPRNSRQKAGSVVRCWGDVCYGLIAADFSYTTPMTRTTKIVYKECSHGKKTPNIPGIPKYKDPL